MALDHPGHGGATASALDAQSTATVDTTGVTDGGIQLTGSGSTAGVSSTVPAIPQRTRTTASGTPSTPATTVRTTVTSQTSSGSTCKSFRGPVEDNQFGSVQVQASVSRSGKICSVKVLQSPTGGRSDRINGRAVPILNKQAMAAQSANIHGVSGATYTTIGYIDSLQAILDAAKA